MSAAFLLDSLIEPLSRCLDRESAQRVIELRFDAATQDKVDALAERANEGLLTEDERADYEALVNAADFISVLKLKARQHLRSQNQ